MFGISCVLLPLSNQISGPIRTSQSNHSNFTYMITTSVNSTQMTKYGDNAVYQLWTFATFFGDNFTSGYHGDVSKHLDCNSVDCNTEFSLANNLTNDNDSCRDSHLTSSARINSINHIPLRVWLTVSWILGMVTVGRCVLSNSQSLYIILINRLTGFTSICVMVGNSALVSIVYVMSCVITTPIYSQLQGVQSMVSDNH